MLRTDNLRLIILIIIITASEALGQYLLRTYHNVHKNSSFKRRHFTFIPTSILPLVTWFLYGICTFLLLYTYNYTTMGKAEVYWDALSALVVPFIGLIILIVGFAGCLILQDRTEKMLKIKNYKEVKK